MRAQKRKKIFTHNIKDIASSSAYLIPKTWLPPPPLKLFFGCKIPVSQTLLQMPKKFTYGQSRVTLNDRARRNSDKAA